MAHENNPPVKLMAWVTTRKGNDFEVELPGRKVVCPRCDGTGKHVNPSIDEHGISPEEFQEDPDFEEAYFSGVYDVTCYRCNGANVIDEVDVDKLTEKMRDRYFRNLDRRTAYDQEASFERRWCV